ncbi:MAG: hypothetical protein ACRDKS_16835, partial [Actinomycetota bacterium]
VLNPAGPPGAVWTVIPWLSTPRRAHFNSSFPVAPPPEAAAVCLGFVVGGIGDVEKVGRLVRGVEVGVEEPGVRDVGVVEPVGSVSGASSLLHAAKSATNATRTASRAVEPARRCRRDDRESVMRSRF